jgi:hypothetical protein
MSKNERDYRGSKSEILSIPIPNRISVKEQRVDGSYCINSKLMRLRCTLMNYENSYLVNNLSKRLNNKQFSTLTQNNKLNP